MTTSNYKGFGTPSKSTEIPTFHKLKIVSLTPDTRTLEYMDGEPLVDQQLKTQWEGEVFNIGYPDWNKETLDKIAERFFGQITSQCFGWLFHEIIVELPDALKFLLSQNEVENVRTEVWCSPMFPLARKQTIKFV